MFNKGGKKKPDTNPSQERGSGETEENWGEVLISIELLLEILLPAFVALVLFTPSQVET